jgi:hypothetical protein
MRKLFLALPLLALGACANMTPDQQAQAPQVCSIAQLGLVLAANHGVDAEQLAKIKADVAIACGALTPAEIAVAQSMAAEAVE